MTHCRWGSAQDKLGLRFSTAYTVNGVLMTTFWFVGRVLLFLWFFRHLWMHRSELSVLAPPALGLLLVVPPLLFALNLWWFSKILRGLAKLLSGSLLKVRQSLIISRSLPLVSCPHTSASPHPHAFMRLHVTTHVPAHTYT